MKTLNEQEKDCQYINNRTAKTYRTKTQAMKEAKPGDIISNQYTGNDWTKN